MLAMPPTGVLILCSMGRSHYKCYPNSLSAYHPLEDAVSGSDVPSAESPHPACKDLLNHDVSGNPYLNSLDKSLIHMQSFSYPCISYLQGMFLKPLLYLDCLFHLLANSALIPIFPIPDNRDGGVKFFDPALVRL